MQKNLLMFMILDSSECWIDEHLFRMQGLYLTNCPTSQNLQLASRFLYDAEEGEHAQRTS